MDPSDTPLLSPLFVGGLAWVAALISLGYQEMGRGWPAQLDGVGAVLFAVMGIALFGYGLATGSIRSFA